MLHTNPPPLLLCTEIISRTHDNILDRHNNVTHPSWLTEHIPHNKAKHSR